MYAYQKRIVKWFISISASLLLSSISVNHALGSVHDLHNKSSNQSISSLKLESNSLLENSIPQAINFKTSAQQIEGLRFELASKDSDVEKILSTIPIDQDRIFLFLDHAHTKDREVISFIRDTFQDIDHFIRKKNDLYGLMYLIYDEDNYVGVGMLNFFSSEDKSMKIQLGISDIHSDPHVISNIGIAVHPDYRNKGYGKRIVAGLTDILKSQTNTRSISYITSPNNVDSINLAIKSGFKEIKTRNKDQLFIKEIDR